MKDVYQLEDAVSYSNRHKVEAEPGIYGLADSSDPQRIRYVGSSGNLRHRLYAHWHSTHARRLNTPKHLWLADLKARGGRLVLVVLERCEVGPCQSSIRNEKEQAHIARLAALGMCDLNVTLTPVGHANSLDTAGKALRAELLRLRAENAELRALLNAEIV